MLLESAGLDATADFDFVGHSDDANKALAAFEVGSVAGHVSLRCSLKFSARPPVPKLINPRG